jgi:hypothetical protein
LYDEFFKPALQSQLQQQQQQQQHHNHLLPQQHQPQQQSYYDFWNGINNPGPLFPASSQDYRHHFRMRSDCLFPESGSIDTTPLTPVSTTTTTSTAGESHPELADLVPIS